MRGSDVRASWAGTSEAIREHYCLAQDAFRQHWLPITAAAAGFYCLWRFVRFIIWAHLSYLSVQGCCAEFALLMSVTAGLAWHEHTLMQMGLQATV